MLEQLRRNSRNFIIWILFAIIIVVFSLNRDIDEENPPRVIQRTGQLLLERVRATPSEHGVEDPDADKVEDRIE